MIRITIELDNFERLTQERVVTALADLSKTVAKYSRVYPEYTLQDPDGRDIGTTNIEVLEIPYLAPGS